MLNLLSNLPLLQMRKAFASFGAGGPVGAQHDTSLIDLAGPCTAGDGAADSLDTAPIGCGWFDSSHDLQHGLCVLEHVGTDTLADALPLDNWLELHLAGWSPALPH